MMPASRVPEEFIPGEPVAVFRSVSRPNVTEVVAGSNVPGANATASVACSPLTVMLAQVMRGRPVSSGGRITDPGNAAQFTEAAEAMGTNIRQADNNVTDVILFT